MNSQYKVRKKSKPEGLHSEGPGSQQRQAYPARHPLMQDNCCARRHLILITSNGYLVPICQDLGAVKDLLIHGFLIDPRKSPRYYYRHAKSYTQSFVLRCLEKRFVSSISQKPTVLWGNPSFKCFLKRARSRHFSRTIRPRQHETIAPKSSSQKTRRSKTEHPAAQSSQSSNPADQSALKVGLRRSLDRRLSGRRGHSRMRNCATIDPWAALSC
jgi:hypothetical protein